MHTQIISRRIAAGLIGVLLLVSATAVADDTDIYLTGTNVIVDEKPNILIIFDNSGSMDTTVPDSGEKYEPSELYTPVKFPPGKIYWSTTGVPADSDSGRSRAFTDSNNRCNTSLNLLSTSGFYQGDRIGRWDANKKKWVDLAANNDPTYIDCKADVDNSDAGTGSPTGLGYPRNSGSGINGPYVSSKTQSNVNWSNLKRPTLYTANYLNWYYSPTSQDKTRIQIAKETIKSIVNGTVNVKFGLMVFNDNYVDDANDDLAHGGRVVKAIVDATDANKTALISTVDGLQAETWTPLSEAMWEAYRYLSGKTVFYGDNYTTETPARDKCAEGYNADPALCTYTGTYTSPFAYACQQAYIIYMTDGAPTIDTNATAKIKTQIGKTSCWGTSGSNGECLPDLANYMYNNDIYSGRDGIQRVATYTIGFQTNQTLLQQTASQGGGKYYTANTAAELTSAFQSAIAEILSITTSFAAPSIAVNAFNRLYNRDAVYLSLFKPESTPLWKGNVKRYKIADCVTADVISGVCAKEGDGKIVDKNGYLAINKDTGRIDDDACSFWTATCPDGATVNMGGAGSVVPARSGRTLFTYTGATAPSNVTLNVTAHKIDVSNDALTLSMLGITPSTNPDPVAAAAEDAQARSDRINWIRGQDLYDENDDLSTTDDRWKFSDALHSRPLAVTYGGSEASPVIKLFVGTNDGGLHMLNETTGVEEWMFIPPALLPMQGRLAENAEGGSPPHPYGMDGTPTAWVKDVDGDALIESATDFVRLYSGMRRGGKLIYALDATPVNVGDVPYPKLMWQIEGGVANTSFAKLGQTWSKPILTKIRYATGTGVDGNDSTTKTVLIFAGGYNESQDNNAWGPDDTSGTGVGTGNAIYIVDPTTGARLWWASNTNSGANLELAGMNFAIPSDITLVDADGDGRTDRLYVGDLGGQLWRIDLGATLGKTTDVNGGSTGARLAKIADDDPATKTDNRKFFYPPDVAQVFDVKYSSTEVYDMVVIASGDREEPLDTSVHNQFYAIRDAQISGKIPNNFTALTASDLYDATANLIQDGTVSEKAAALSALRSAKGWLIDLKESGGSWIGEKGLASPLVFDGKLFFTTFVPSAAADPNVVSCQPTEGTARFYQIDLLSAAAVADSNSDGSTNKADRYVNLGGGIPSDIVLQFQPDSVSGLITVSGGISTQKLGGRQRIKTFWYQK